MGKGDIKTKKGKISNGSFEVRRPKKAKPVAVKPKNKAKKSSKAKK
ncbi:MAG: 30S ribosomal protein THX [Bacteroidetes bacterium]|nr:30S ribosomal protein THX [Bacteroidota bacterium]MDA1121742.1 30S ribosomal protein THX [Bacteroidota bacterium]